MLQGVCKVHYMCMEYASVWEQNCSRSVVTLLRGPGAFWRLHTGSQEPLSTVFAAFQSLYNGCHFESLQLEFMCDSCLDIVQTFQIHWLHPTNSSVFWPVFSAAACRRTYRPKLMVKLLLTLSRAYCSSIHLGLIWTNPNQKAFRRDFLWIPVCWFYWKCYKWTNKSLPFFAFCFWLHNSWSWFLNQCKKELVWASNSPGLAGV